MVTRPYDTTGQTVAGFDDATKAGGYSAFSFTNTIAGNLIQVQLELQDVSGSTDGGSVTVALYNSGGTMPAVKLAMLGIISDASLSTSGSLITLAVPAGVTLRASTRYWIEVTGSSNSNAQLGYESADAGTGASGEYYYEPQYGSASDDTGATIASVTVVACYCPGTLILTNLGEVAVEALSIGDTVLTADGLVDPVRWIGRRSYAGQFVAGNPLMLPVTIRRGALAEEVPHTDLQVSPGHAIWVDGQLIPAWRLVNGVTITQAESVAEVTYLHVELGRHALLMANGAAAESFLAEPGLRGQFHNAAEFYDRYGDAVEIAPMQARLEDGFGLQRIQERLAMRAGLLPSIEPVGVLHGFVDRAGPGRVSGWAQDLDSPEEPVALEVLADGVPVVCVLANGWRADLRAAGMGSGCHAFDMALPDWATGLVSVRRVIDGSELALTATARDWRLAA